MIYPISFCIPECKIIKEICVKERLFASIIPGKGETYNYKTEKDYYEGYQKSVFGITMQKAGWDCMRHYEILANGCIPWFENLEACPPNTMTHFPKELVIEAMKKHKIISDPSLPKTIQTLLNYTRTHLTTKAMASYVLKTSGNTHVKSVLFLSGDLWSDYLRDLLLHGFKELFGTECNDYPRVDLLYTDYPDSKLSELHGKGMTNAQLLEPILHDSSKGATIEKDIENHVYDCVVYGSLHRGMPFWNKVVKSYKAKEIILLCGEDNHDCKYVNFFGDDKEHNLFIREL